MKINYLIIPLITVITAIAGSSYTGSGMAWYNTIKLPSWTPPGAIIGIVWTVIFILATIAALMVYNLAPRPQNFRLILEIFVANIILNFTWSWLFFGQHQLAAAVWEAGALGLSVVILMILIWPISRIASLILAPYAGWVFFATYLTYNVWILNK